MPHHNHEFLPLHIPDTFTPGDVVTEAGDILVNVPSLEDPDGKGIMRSGVVTVTLEQAEKARAHGWVPLLGTEVEGLVQISRGVH